MNPMKYLCLVACLLGAVCAVPNGNSNSGNRVSNSLKPSEWISQEQLEQIPSLDELTLEKLQEMPLNRGAELINTLYHVARAGNALTPIYVPSPSNVPVEIVKPNGQKVTTTLSAAVQTAKQQSGFGTGELIMIITGYSDQLPVVKTALRELEGAIMARQNERPRANNREFDYGSMQRSSSEENYDEALAAAKSAAPTATLMIVKLGEALNNAKRIINLDVPKTGAMIGKMIVQLTEEAGVTPDSIHILAQGIAAHVAGACGRQYTRLTGHQVRRITALDPSKIFAKKPNTLPGLNRGDAEFVDAIHTSAYGLGTSRSVGDVDFYPNGPSQGVVGADNVVKAAMRATRYFAESVRPGNEKNFPAVQARSLEQYKTNNGWGKRTYMGIDVDYDIKGEYMLDVNPRAPFGQRAPAQKQNTYHGVHRNSKMNAQDYE